MAVTTLSLETIVLQAAFFLNKIDLSDRLRAATSISDGLKGVFDGNPTILPIPDDAPRDFPRVILSSKDGIYSCSITPERVDFTYDKSKMITNGESKHDIDKKFLDHVSDLVAIILNDLQGSIYRLVLITRFKHTLKEGGVNFLKSKLSNEFSEGAKELQLHRLRTIEIDGFKANHWVRLISQGSIAEKRWLLVVSDLNTLQTERYNITQKNGELFFNVALSMTRKAIKEILQA